MGTELLLILVGIVLRHNPGWFGGAHEVGSICLFAGLTILALELIVAFGMLLLGVASFRRRG